MKTTKRRPLFERLKQALEEAISHTKGKLPLRTVETPEDPPKMEVIRPRQASRQRR
jgi:hypothetical protein